MGNKEMGAQCTHAHTVTHAFYPIVQGVEAGMLSVWLYEGSKALGAHCTIAHIHTFNHIVHPTQGSKELSAYSFTHSPTHTLTHTHSPTHAVRSQEVEAGTLSVRLYEGNKELGALPKGEVLARLLRAVASRTEFPASA